MDGRGTIVAVASPPGRGLRGLVRVSGDAARTVARRVLGSDPPRRGVFRARARLGVHGSCPVLAMWMDAGASFTGEDSLEFSCVGSPDLLDALAADCVEAARSAGHDARRARPGEFAYRAFLGGRIDSVEAEALAARIAATNDSELAAADELARGEMGVRAAELAARIAELLALVEAGIDFTDQDDVIAIAPETLAARSRELADRCESLRGARASERTRTVPLVVLAGAPNAGKSTLFNALLGRARTIASEWAGTTRDAIVERIGIGGGIEVDLADLAGLDHAGAETSRAIHERMQAHALSMLACADIVLHCVAPGGKGVGLATRGEVIEVATMCDRALAPGAGIAVSAKTGAGIEVLRGMIAMIVKSDRAFRRASLAAVLPRQDAAFEQAAGALREVSQRATAGGAAGIELVASLLRAALDEIGEVTGPVHPDEVLGLVFSRFCIGK